MKHVIMAKSAIKYIKKQGTKAADKIYGGIYDLRKEPMQGDIEIIRGEKNKMRLRIGSYRVLFKVENDIITVTDIGPRGDIYK